MHLKDNKGSILIPFIITVLLMALLGIGVSNLSTSSSLGELQANNGDSAYELAMAGMRYGIALGQNNYAATTFQMSQTSDTSGSNHTFTVSISNGTLTSIGVVSPGTFWEARRVITASLPSGISGSGGTADNTKIGTNNGDMPGFGSPNGGGSNPSGAIVPNSANNSIAMGGSALNSFGSLWYQGSSSAGNCTNGSCFFGSGLNVYFEFTFPEDNTVGSTNNGDGFTFAVISALTNTPNVSGGNPSAASVDSSHNNAAGGELIGFAGPGNTQTGIKPPKIALQFDTYPNGASADVCGAGSRNDATSNANHNFNNVSLMFWGDRTLAGNCTYNDGGSYPIYTFYDNVHGASGSGSPGNAPNSTGNGDYYAGPSHSCNSAPGTTCNWMEDGWPYMARMEIIRSTVTNNAGTYRIKAWVGRQNWSDWSCSTNNNATGLKNVQNVGAAYTDCPPQIDRTVSLSAADHGNFNKIYFGLTEETGAATQLVTLQNLQVGFPQYSPTCTLTSATNPVPYNNTTVLTWTVAGNATSATWTTSPGGTCASPNQAGGSCTTGSLTTPGATIYTLTVTNAIGSNTCSTTVYVGCQGYRIWDNFDITARPFLVTGGACRTNLIRGNEITNGTPQLTIGGTVTRYAGGAANCSAGGRPSISYTDAMNADILLNGGNGDCQVCYDAGDTVGDRTGGTTCH